MAALALVLGALATIPAGVRSIGVCYGMNGDDLPSASDVVQLYKDNGIDSMRIYSPDTDVLQALSGSGIAVTVGVPNADVGGLASRPSAAAAWVQSYVLAFPAVQFRYIAVGNEVVAGGRVLLPAMRNLDRALSAAGLADDIKVSTAVAIDVVGSSFPPSAGTFAPSAGYMARVARYLQSTGAPLLANLYPYYSYISDPGAVDINYALLAMPAGTVVVQDGGYSYDSLFDAMVDCFYSALENAGAGNVTVVVSESGWPSAGSDAANTTNSQAYSQNLINHVGQGTPKRPGPIEAYIFATFNEDQKLGDDETRRHFGLFNKDRSLVYPVDFVNP
jgi:exo-beta-1,3-glucanase (GH17 family)